MKYDTQKILGKFVFDSLDKQDGVTWEAFAAFFEKFYKKYIDMGYNGCLECNFLKYLTPEARKWLCEIFSEEEKPEPPKEVFYHIGQRFRRGHWNYLLTICESNEQKDDWPHIYIALININGQHCGRPYSPSIKVNYFDKITKEEFKGICGGSPDGFTLIEETKDEEDDK